MSARPALRPKSAHMETKQNRRRAQVIAAAAPVLAASGALADKVRLGVTQHLLNNRAELVSTIAFSQRVLPGRARRELSALGRVYERLWERIVRNAVRAHELPPDFDCRAATVALLALCN